VQSGGIGGAGERAGVAEWLQKTLGAEMAWKSGDEYRAEDIGPQRRKYSTKSFVYMYCIVKIVAVKFSSTQFFSVWISSLYRGFWLGFDARKYLLWKVKFIWLIFIEFWNWCFLLISELQVIWNTNSFEDSLLRGCIKNWRMFDTRRFEKRGENNPCELTRWRITAGASTCTGAASLWLHAPIRILNPQSFF